MTNQVLEAIEKRSSARAYSEEKIPEEMLEAIITAGLQAPTAANRKEIRFSVVDGSNPILEELDAEMRRMRNQERPPHNFYYEAPSIIFLSGDDSYVWSKLDAGIAVQNMALAAESMGLGSLIIGCVNDAMHGEKQEYFSKALKMPEGFSFAIAIAVGYKTDAKVPHDFDRAEQVFCVE